MTKIVNFDTIYIIEHKPKSDLRDRPCRIWDVGENTTNAKDFINGLKEAYPKHQFMLVREIEIK